MIELTAALISVLVTFFTVKKSTEETKKEFDSLQLAQLNELRKLKNLPPLESLEQDDKFENVGIFESIKSSYSFIKNNFMEILFKSGLSFLVLASLICLFIGFLTLFNKMSFEDAANIVTIIVSIMTMFSFSIGYYKLFREDKNN